MKMKTENIHYLLSCWLDTEFQPKLLMSISAETFCKIKQQMFDVFDEAELTDADVKSAWKEWIEKAVYGGCIVEHHFQIVDDEKHTELEIYDSIIKMANAAIDKLPEVAEVNDVGKYVNDITNFKKFIDESLPSADATEEEWNNFYDKDWIISFGNTSVAIHNEATIYSSMLDVVKEYIKDCL